MTAAKPQELSEVAKRAWVLARRKASENDHDAALEQYRFLLSEVQGEPLQEVQLEAALVLVARGVQRRR